MIRNDMLNSLIKRYEDCMFTVNRRLNAMFREMMPEGMTPDQYATLRYLRERERATSSELAESFCVGKSSITAIVTRLFEKNLVRREPDARDRRVTYLAVTAEGRALADQLEVQMIELLAPYIRQFEEEEVRAFMATYERLSRVLAQTPPAAVEAEGSEGEPEEAEVRTEEGAETEAEVRTEEGAETEAEVRTEEGAETEAEVRTEEGAETKAEVRTEQMAAGKDQAAEKGAGKR